MSIEYKDRGALHKLFSSAKLKKHSSKPLFKIAAKPFLALETTALFSKDLITNHFVGKETHVKFERKKSSSGKFHTTVKFVRSDKPVYREPGLLHRARDFRRRFEGAPSFSIEKKLSNMQPKTVKGKVIHSASKFTVRSAKMPLKFAGKALLSAETAAYTASSAGLRKLTNNTRAEFNQADTGKAVLSAATAVRTFSRARKAIVRKRLRKVSQKIKKQTYAAEKAKTKKEKTTFKKEKQLVKAEKKKNKAKIKTIKQKKNFNVNRVAVLQGRTAFEKEKLKLEKKKYKNQKAFKRHALKQKHLDMAVPLSLTATAFLGGQLLGKFSQYVVSADPDNDFVKAIDKSARAINSTRRQASNVSKRARHKNAEKRQSKLNKKHNKLQNKSSKLQKNKRKKVKRKQKISKAKNKSTKAVSNALMKFGKFAVKLVFSMLAPILFVLMLFSLAMMLFGGGSSNSTYILGTYNCRDYDIACAVEHYTSLANNMNNNVIKTQNSSKWKTGLRGLGVSQSTLNTYEDTPDDFIFGQSDVFPSVPVYDFEADKLIAFMCAYTYPFTDDNAGAGSTDNGDIVPWTYNSSEHDGIINELFELEYEFKHRYINTSHWVNLPNFESSGYLYADSTGITTASNGVKYGFVTFTDLVPAELKSFAVGNTVYFELQYGEVINRNRSFGKTGYYMQNLNYEYTAPNGSVLNSFYSIFHDPNTGENFFGYMGPNNVPQRKTQLYIGSYEFNYAIAPRDTKIWTGDQTTGNKQLVRYYRAEEYIKECKLYTTVRRKRTIDQAIEYMLRHKDGDNRAAVSSRIQFYNTLMALDKEPDERTYGNHMMFLSPLTTDFAQLQSQGKVFNSHGYDVQGWALKHCGINGIHNGIDFEAASGSEVKAIISGKVESIDTSKHLLVLQSTSDLDYWYEDKSHATKVYYENINPSVSVGDEVKAGDIIGVVDSYKHCFDNQDNTAASKNYLHVGVEIQYDWWVWETVDPQFLFYRSDADVVAKSE
ncbi:MULTISPECIES: M23 family metallopeptidase [unclassified Ruminococcus]|uniref:M23 family metallopeptidase n=1 Tax=unclassified Ruminococcus TaxID=2608920 RepID=UPI00210AE61A|nr:MULTISPECIES: M23 family metallopeptidase [unclassified Ruminococcus]MCQ4021745.1 peptidoglycan DD-metalloendopeptidase family protein [Ruminococcus sp. zg-924]MCQ4114189.1 peptidoglycan DD-metalloendopeptidase family protein [Ruminococcus sp. zg-921]